MIEAKKGATTLSKFSYVYQLSANETAQRQSVTDKDGNKTSYAYGGVDRLTRAEIKNSAGTTTDLRAWAYDNASNRTQQNANGTVTSYAYNQANQLCWAFTGTSTAGCAAPPTGAVPYRYDANGNETQGTAGRISTYNIRDQLTSLTVGGVTSNFGYAGPSQSERTSSGGTAQRNNGLGLSGQGTTNWTRDENGSLISQRASAAKHYYLTDALGSVTALTDSSGNVAQTYKTDAFGVPTGGTGSVANPWQFAGEYRDPPANADLYKIGARNYDATLGRWTQQDPLDQPNDLQNANKYAYGASNPVNITDPSGTAHDGGGYASPATKRLLKGIPCTFTPTDDPSGIDISKCPDNSRNEFKKAIEGCVKGFALGLLGDIADARLRGENVRKLRIGPSGCIIGALES